MRLVRLTALFLVILLPEDAGNIRVPLRSCLSFVLPEALLFVYSKAGVYALRSFLRRRAVWGPSEASGPSVRLLGSARRVSLASVPSAMNEASGFYHSVGLILNDPLFKNTLSEQASGLIMDSLIEEPLEIIEPLLFLTYYTQNRNQLGAPGRSR